MDELIPYSIHQVINKDKINSLAALKRVDSEVGAQRTLRHRGILQVTTDQHT